MCVDQEGGGEGVLFSYYLCGCLCVSAGLVCVCVFCVPLVVKQGQVYVLVVSEVGVEGGSVCGGWSRGWGRGRELIVSEPLPLSWHPSRMLGT